MKNPIKNFLKEEKGQGMTEYGLILGVIGVVAVGAFAMFGDTINAKFVEVKEQIFPGSGAE